MRIYDFAKMYSKVKQIDFMFSIGLNCRAAINIQSNGLRFFSSPLDFVEVSTIKSVLHLFESKFNDFFENYKVDYSKETATDCYWIDDITNGIYTLHYLKKGMPVVESYKKFKEVMNRRAKRLDELLTNAEKIVIVSERDESKEELTWFINEFSKLYPKLNIELINMRNDMKMNFDEILEEKVFENKKLSYTEYYFNDTRNYHVVAEGNIVAWSKVLLQYENVNLLQLKKDWKALRDKYAYIVLFGADRKVARVANWLTNIGLRVDSVVGSVENATFKESSCIIICIDEKANGIYDIDHIKKVLVDKGNEDVLICDNFLRIK